MGLKPAATFPVLEPSSAGFDVYLLPVADVFLVLSPLRGLNALVNRAAVTALAARLHDLQEDSESSGPIDSLLELRVPVEPPPIRSGVLDPQFLGLIPTRSCNLGCVYCGFGAAPAGRQEMDLSLAVAAVDWMAETASALARPTLDVHFFGGEPFVAAELIEVAVHRARRQAVSRNLIPRFEVATNGIMEPSMASWAGDFIDTIVLSLDGSAQAHNRHRPYLDGSGSFSKVLETALIFRESPAKLCLRVCVSELNVTDLEAAAADLCEQLEPSVIDFEALQPTPSSTAAGLSAPDPYELAAHVTRACLLTEQCGVQAVFAPAEAGPPQHSFCPVGKDAVIVNPDGIVSCCYLPARQWQERGLDLVIGQLSSARGMVLEARAIEGLRRLVTAKPRCQRCFCRWTCAGGCHVNHLDSGQVADYDNHCIQTRIISACLLLHRLNRDDALQSLLADRAAMERIAQLPSDLLVDQLGVSG